jgi:hypothetical protein
MTEQPENAPESPTPSSESPQATPGPETVRSPDFKMVYANNVNLTGSAWDIRMTFGELFTDIFGKTLLEQRVMVTVSPQMAKVMAFTINSAVKNYEAQIGEIKMPPLEQSPKQSSS